MAAQGKLPAPMRLLNRRREDNEPPKPEGETPDRNGVAPAEPDDAAPFHSRLPANAVIYLSSAGDDSTAEWAARLQFEGPGSMTLELMSDEAADDPAGPDPSEPVARDANELPDALWAVAVTPKGLARFRLEVRSRRGAYFSCSAPVDIEVGDRRTLFRVPVAIPVELYVGRLRLEGTALDLGIGGLLVRMAAPIPAGTTVEIELALGSGSLSTTAVVCYCKSDDWGVSAGLEFTGISTTASADITRFIGRWQRRLLPCVHVARRALRRDPTAPGNAREVTLTRISPGLLTFITPGPIPPSTRVVLTMRLGDRTFELPGTAVRSEATDRRSFHVDVVTDLLDDGREADLRMAVRDLHLGESW